MSKPKGYILYEGPSLLDSKPIVVIATLKSLNTKTGNMVQTFIIRSDINPIDAVYSGQDSSICGDCRHRGDNGRWRTCYVNVAQSVLGVFASYKRGNYPVANIQDIQKYFSGRKIRCGAYGDPTAAPYEMWETLLDVSGGFTGYSHQWRQPRFQEFKNICMASVDSLEEYLEARSLGWRTFRVRESTSQLDNGMEVMCPASEEAGKRLTCEQCLACSGLGLGKLTTAAGGINIIVHGKSKKRFSALTIEGN